MAKGEGGEVVVERVKILGVENAPRRVTLNGKRVDEDKVKWSRSTKVVAIDMRINVGSSFELEVD